MDGVTLIVDAGGTKTDWLLTDGRNVSRYRTSGINLALMSKESVLSVVFSASEQMGGSQYAVRQIRYYGAGVTGSSHIIELDAVLKNVFPGASVSYGSDLLAAAEACLGGNAGIVCILGTGSNSGLYDGKKIVSNIRPGGYVLGDEGSGNALGRALLSDFIKDRLPDSIKDLFRKEYGLTYSEITEKVYRGGNPAGYLASFAPFIFANRGDAYVDGLIDRNLRSFIERSVLPYGPDTPGVAVAGSVGYECREDLVRLGREYGLDFIRFVKNPAEAIAEGIIDGSGRFCNKMESNV